MVTLRERPLLDDSSLCLPDPLSVLHLLRDRGQASAAMLAEAAHLSLPATSGLVDELELCGLVERVATADPSRGTDDSRMYRLRPGGVRSGAVLVSVDTVQVAVIDAGAELLGSLYRPLGTDKRPDAVIGLIVKALKELLFRLRLSASDLLGVGIGVPGLTSFHSGIVHFAPHLPQWSEVPLGTRLEEQLRTSVWVDNDSHVQALAERYFGLGQDGGEFVTVQSGIGLSAAFYLDGTLYRGPRDTAGEIGHMIVQEDGRLCDCGSWGCWETIASITWLVDEACRAEDGNFRLPDWLDIPKFAEQDYQSIWDIEPSVVRLAAHAIFQAANQGRQEAIALVRQHGTYFGIGLANLANMLNAQRIIIWGDDIAAGEIFLETVRDSVSKRALGHPGKTCEIVFSKLGHDVALIGAGCLAIDALFGGA
ncbi:MAG: ROK family protein [Ktedonobacterales bacterium]